MTVHITMLPSAKKINKQSREGFGRIDFASFSKVGGILISGGTPVDFCGLSNVRLKLPPLPLTILGRVQIIDIAHGDSTTTRHSRKFTTIAHQKVP